MRKYIPQQDTFIEKTAIHIVLKQYQQKEKKKTEFTFVLPESNYCLSGTEWQFVALAKAILCFMSKKITLCNKNMFQANLDTVTEEQKIVSLVSILILKTKKPTIAYGNST